MSERERFEAGSGPMLSDEWIEEHWRQAYSQKAFPALTHYTAAVERAVVDQLWSGQAASGSQENARSDVRTGWPPGLLQDDSRELSRALASKPDAMVHARDAVAKIGQPEAPTADPGANRPRCRFCGGSGKVKQYTSAGAHQPEIACQFCKRASSGSWCPTAEGCAAHGCHGACLPIEQEAPTAAPEFTIDDPDLNDFANAVHLLVTPGCGGHDAGMAYLMALDRLQARLADHPPARSGADFSTSDPCPSCRGVGSIGEPPIQCPFCRLHKLGQEAARSGAGSDDRKDESWK